MRANEGLWVGWPGGTDVDLEPFEHDGMTLDPIALSAEEIERVLRGLQQRHPLAALPRPGRQAGVPPGVVGQPTSTSTGASPSGPPTRAAKNATVWVQDYQLQLVPQLLRELRPDLRIGFFLHIPFPPAELFQQLPWRRQILEGLLGADLIGFQLPGGAANFVRLVRQRVGHKTHRDLVYLPDDRTVRAEAFPISIDYQGFEELARSEGVQERSASIREAAGRPRRSSPRHRPARLHQGHLRPAARVLRAAPRRRARRRRRGVRAGRDTRRGRRSRSTASCATRSTASSGASTATSAGSAARRSATCTRRTPARRWPRSTGPPT